jgi:predicted nucleic acid-binding protein
LSISVVIDTCALFPPTLRDVLLRAAEADLYRIRWSAEILAELRRVLQSDSRVQLSDERAMYLLTEMRRSFPEAMINGYGHLIPTMTNDPGDRHILAAAIHADAKVIVTDNLKDFPENSLAPFDIEVQTPDEFLLYLYDLDQERVANIIIELNASYRKRPEPLSQTIARLSKTVPIFSDQISRNPTIVRLLQS